MTSNSAPTEPATPTGAAGSVASGAPDAGVVRVRLDIAYDGTDFSGWARQPERRTVCGLLETTLAMILRQPVHLTVAGRTDAGVHATGQVAHLDLPAALYAEHEALLLRRLGGLLPADLRVTAARVVPADFDARFSGISRTYQYRVCDRPWGVPPLRRHDVAHWSRPLDVRRMADASAALLGLHDFAAYCRARDGATTIRTLQQLDWQRDDDIATATITADAFCHSMVRSLMGALLAVGGGTQDADWPAALLNADRRSSSVVVAPAHGLTLVRVDYPPDHLLAERNVTTRARRTSSSAEGSPT